ncbi:MAG TPA: magnesium transporter [Xanthomonadales bacterium]|nr:magnesium transporter [Xanthomonadales bacterium]
MTDSKQPVLEDDTKEPMTLMVEHRFPWLAVGLVGGIGLTLLASNFEELLSKNLALSYFVPVIVYMASAVGQQTDIVYIRNLNKKRTHFLVYLAKELLLCGLMGLLFGSLIGLFAYFMFQSTAISISVGLAMAVTMGIAPFISLTVPTILKKVHKDPAVGTGPFVTVIQDFLSLLIYFLIATVIIF